MFAPLKQLAAKRPTPARLVPGWFVKPPSWAKHPLLRRLDYWPKPIAAGAGALVGAALCATAVVWWPWCLGLLSLGALLMLAVPLCSWSCPPAWIHCYIGSLAFRRAFRRRVSGDRAPWGIVRSTLCARARGWCIRQLRMSDSTCRIHLATMRVEIAAHMIRCVM